jgi:UDP-N-acetylmuramyl pentapeptide phosphotransferase/UDP-N-acetylglucosamine-1-phosphate transferase
MRAGDVLVAFGAAILTLVSVRLTPELIRPPVGANHRGRRVPIVLGMALVFGVAVTELAALAGAALAHRPVDSGQLWLMAGIGGVFAAGLHDDRQPERVRGLVTHLRALARGRVTSGILKLVAAVAAALVWVAASHGSAGRFVLGVPLIAGSANLWNLLDVAPGRALKFGLVAGLALFLARPTTLVGATVGATAVLLPLDVREHAMLGDSGANVLGFVLGVGLYDRLSTPWMAAALAGILVLHLLAETVTLSRLIAGATPLAWFDRLWTLPVERTSPGGRTPGGNSPRPGRSL